MYLRKNLSRRDIYDLINAEQPHPEQTKGLDY